MVFDGEREQKTRSPWLDPFSFSLSLLSTHSPAWDAAPDPASDLAASTGPLWETGWDDEGLDDEFSAALKGVLEKAGGNGGVVGQQQQAQAAPQPPAPPPQG